jgi:hypothetical protein
MLTATTGALVLGGTGVSFWYYARSSARSPRAVPPFFRSCFARARCHSGVAWASSSRGLSGSSSIDIFCPCGTKPAGAPASVYTEIGVPTVGQFMGTAARAPLTH